MYQKTLSILVAEHIKIPAESLPPLLERKIHERLVFTNPDYEQRHSRGEWLGNIPPQISCIRKAGRHYLLPRGFLHQLIELCKKLQQPYRLVDRRRSFDLLPIEFHGHLKEYQMEAAEAVFKRDLATLVGGYKSGKTVIALYTVAQRRQPVLVLIPRLDLLDGWVTKIENFLQIPRSEIGIYAEKKRQIGEWITVAHTGEVMRNWRELRERVGYLILDECQRCPSKVFTHLVSHFDSRYMLGLGNTTQRRDRLSRFIYYYVGDVIYTIDEKDAREGRGILQAHIVARTTEFEYPYQTRDDYDAMLQALMQDPKRTNLIADDIAAELQEQSQPLVVLSGGEEQHRTLLANLVKRGIEVIELDQMDAPHMAQEGQARFDAAEVENLQPQGGTVILATPQTLTRYAQKLSSQVLFLAIPIYFRKVLVEAIRNLATEGISRGSGFKIYDYVDQRVGLLDNYFRMRSYNYGVHPDTLLHGG